jgi:hypothetical protein
LDKERKKYVKRKKRSVALSSYSAPKTGVWTHSWEKMDSSTRMNFKTIGVKNDVRGICVNECETVLFSRMGRPLWADRTKKTSVKFIVSYIYPRIGTSKAKVF